MKKHTLIFIILILFSCDDDDMPNQFTSVEGYVTDYYSEKPIADLPVLITDEESFCFSECDDIAMDTLYTNEEGYYYYEFYNDSNRHYHVQVLRTENHVPSNFIKIMEGEKNTTNFALKPFRTLDLNFYNKKKIFNVIYIHFYNDDKNLNLRPSEDLTATQFKLIPETENVFYIVLSHHTVVDGANKVDTVWSEYYKFYSGINDTTITYNY
ncbi:MAG: hypothetical protein ACERKD_04385 [Prolixibacteraceae bacterium]